MAPNSEITELENEIQELRKTLHEKENTLRLLKQSSLVIDTNVLTNDDICRYSRQMVMPQFGVDNQLKLKNSSVLIVGTGGLGCPAALYLAGAGVGTIGLVDYDEVELSNLHRQLLHSESSVGITKVASASNALSKLNSHIEIHEYNLQLDSSNALEIISKYDVVVDATDNVATRYLVNDACILLNRTLVSGSALRMEGQLMVYNYLDGPCYRCIFPEPPPPETVTNCGDGGVLGAVPGVIGVLQAIETIKVLTKNPNVLSKRLLLFDATEMIFRNVKLRGKNSKCNICSDEPTITHLIDYEQFCGAKATDKDPKLKILEPHDRIKPIDYKNLLCDHILIDVRSAEEYKMCNIKPSINIPINDLCNNRKNNEIMKSIKDRNKPVYVVCRRGNDSQRVVKYLKDSFKNSYDIPIVDIVGGLHQWAKDVDTTFPVY